MYIETATRAVEVAKELYENRAWFAETLAKLQFWIEQGHLIIPVFGLGGTGKTTVGRVLSGTLNPYSGPTGRGAEIGIYDESMATKPFKVKGKLVCTMIVPPGQKARQKFHWKPLLTMVATGKAKVVINVTCFGYHSFSAESYTLLKSIYKNGM